MFPYLRGCQSSSSTTFACLNHQFSSCFHMCFSYFSCFNPPLFHLFSIQSKHSIRIPCRKWGIPGFCCQKQMFSQVFPMVKSPCSPRPPKPPRPPPARRCPAAAASGASSERPGRSCAAWNRAPGKITMRNWWVRMVVFLWLIVVNSD